MRATFVTLWAITDDMARRVTIRQSDDGTYAAVLNGYRTDITIDPTDVVLWATDGTVTRAASAHLMGAGDGRHSQSAVGRFTIPVSHLTDRKGRLMGRWASMADRACYLLNTSDAVYHGETYDERLDELVAITNQLDW